MTAAPQLQRRQCDKQGGGAGRHGIRIARHTEVPDEGLAITFLEMPLITKVHIPFPIIAEYLLHGRQLRVPEREPPRHRGRAGFWPAKARQLI